MRGLAIISVLCVAGTAHAHAQSISVIAEEPLAATVGHWLSSRGHMVVEGGLPADAAGTLRDCFVIEDPGCARGVVDRFATANTIVYITVQRDRKTIVHTYLLVKGQPPKSRRTECSDCTDAMLRDHVVTSVAQIANVPLQTAGGSAPTVANRAPATPQKPSAAPAGLAIGIEVGEPTSATVAWFRDRLSLSAGLGTGTFEGAGILLSAGAQLAITELAPRVPLRVGLGGRLYHHGYQAMSIDELPDTHYGVFASASIALERGPLQLYAQLAPGIDLVRTQSCTLANGPNTICPHAQETPLFVHFMVGVRWFLSH